MPLRLLETATSTIYVLLLYNRHSDVSRIIVFSFYICAPLENHLILGHCNYNEDSNYCVHVFVMFTKLMIKILCISCKDCVLVHCINCLQVLFCAIATSYFLASSL